MPSKSWPHTHLANTLILMYDQHVWTKGHRDSLVTLCSWLVSLNSNVKGVLNAKRKMLNAKRRHYHINAAWYIAFWWWVGIFQSYPALCLRLCWECRNVQTPNPICSILVWCVGVLFEIHQALEAAQNLTRRWVEFLGCFSLVLCKKFATSVGQFIFTIQYNLISWNICYCRYNFQIKSFCLWRRWPEPL